jgi:hypothetical protein
MNISIRLIGGRVLEVDTLGPGRIRTVALRTSATIKIQLSIEYSSIA